MGTPLYIVQPIALFTPHEFHDTDLLPLTLSVRKAPHSLHVYDIVLLYLHVQVIICMRTDQHIGRYCTNYLFFYVEMYYSNVYFIGHKDFHCPQSPIETV